MPPPRTGYAPAALDTRGIEEFLRAAGVDVSAPSSPRARAVSDASDYAGPSPEELAAMAEDPAARARPEDADVSVPIGPLERRAIAEDPTGPDASVPVGPAERAEIAAAAADANRAALIAMNEADAADRAAAAREAAYRAGPPVAVSLDAPRVALDDPSRWVRTPAGAHGGIPAAGGLSVPAWAPDLGATLPGSPPISAADIADAVGVRRPVGAGRGGRAAPAAPEMSAEEALIALLTDRPRGADMLFPEDSRTASPLDRALGFNEDRRVLEARRSETRASAYADTADALAASEEARADSERMRSDAMGAARERYRRAVDRANEMTLDPEGWYHDRGVAGTIGAAIAMGMGSFGALLSGGTNEAASIISDSIDRDLQAQQQRIDSAYRGADAEAGILDMLASEFDSRGAAVEAARASMLEQVANQLAQDEQSLAGTEAGIAAREMRDQLMREAAAAATASANAAFNDELARRRALAETISAEAEATRDARRAAGGTGAPSYEEPTEARLNAANRLIDSGTDPARAAAAVGIDPTLLGGASRFAEASAGDSAAASARLSSTVGVIERLIAENPDDIPGVGIFDGPTAGLTERGRAMRQHLDALVNMYGRVHSGGAITTDEQELFRSILFGHGTEAELRTGLEQIRAEIGSSESRDREGRGLGTMLDDVTAALGGEVVE